LEILYSSPNPHSPTSIYYSQSGIPEYDEENKITSVVEKVSYISWKEFFQLPDLKGKHSLRVDVDPAANEVSLISITYYTKLVLLGNVPVYEEMPKSLNRQILLSHELLIKSSNQELLLSFSNKNRSFQMILDQRLIASNALLSTKNMIVGYISILLSVT
jgi:hypothetical protein